MNLLKSRKKLEKELKEITASYEIQKSNNLILLGNAEELREQLRIAEKTIKSLEEELNSVREASFEGAKKKVGRPKKRNG